MLDAVEILNEKVGETVPVVAGVVGPAGLASMLAGMENYLMWFVTNPDVVEEFMGVLIDACIEYANGLLERGAHAITLIDSEAGPDIISPQMFETSVFPLYKKFCREVRGFKVLHMCGDATAVLDPLADAGFDGISIEEKVDVSSAKRITGDRVRLIGNVSPSDTLLTKGTEAVLIEATACLEDGIDILAPGCGCSNINHIASTYSLAYPQSRSASKLPSFKTSRRPNLISLKHIVIFRVTNVLPLRSDSWLKRIPLQAYNW